MSRLFIGNFDFEHRLAAPGRQLPAKLQRLNAELATSWLAIAYEFDYVWTPEPIDSQFFEQAASDGLPRVIPVVSFDDVPPEVECVPWGWTDDIRKLCDSHGWVRNDPPDSAVRAANSRRLSSELEQEWRVGLPFSGEATSIEQLEHYIGLHGQDARWVIKAEFGMSGRERLLGNGVPQGANRSWIEKRLVANGIVFFEPWMKNVQEVGIQIDVPRAGDPQLLEVVPMIADDRGQYTGSRLPSLLAEQTHVVLRPSDWGLAIDIALQAARRIQDMGYFGPLGIDAMQFQDENGQLHVRPLQDINARWTMGRLSLGFRRRLKSHESAEWLHGAENMVATMNAKGAIEVLQALLTTKGMRLTPERETIVSHVMAMRGVFDEESVLTLVGDRISRSTVYRTFAFLEELGLIGEISNVDGHRLWWHRVTSDERRIPTSPAAVGNQVCSHSSLLLVHPN